VREPPAFAVSREGTTWEVALDGLEWSEPDDGFRDREHAFRNAERRRVAYVAATRARDLLVLPVAQGGKPGWIHSALADGAPAELVEVLAPFDPATPPGWAAAAVPVPPAPPAGPAAIEVRVHDEWMDALQAAARPRLATASVTGEAHREEGAPPPLPSPAATDPDADEVDEPVPPRRESRYGPVFGETVHRAIGLALAGLSPAAAVARAAVATGLAGRRDEAALDVGHALVALEAEGLRRVPGPDLRLEYPLAAPARGGEVLVQGYADLVGIASGGTGALAVVDFKTDQPPPPGARVQETHAEYVAQVRAYARMLGELGLAEPGTVRAGLLFTASGDLRWVG
jgi:ATP-dependent helicase/nuclease subunit A